MQVFFSSKRYDHVPEVVQKRRNEKDAAEKDAKKLHQQKIEEEARNAQKRHEEELAKSKSQMDEEEEENFEEEERLDAAEIQSNDGEEAIEDKVEDEEGNDAEQELNGAENESSEAVEEEEENEGNALPNEGDTVWLKDIYGNWAAEEGYEVNHVYRCTFVCVNEGGDMTVTLHDAYDETVDNMVNDELLLDDEVSLEVGYRVWVMNPERDGWIENEMYQGVINEVNGDVFVITFDDGEVEDNVARTEIYRYFDE